METKEIWKKINIETSYHYEVSTLGNVKRGSYFINYKDGRVRHYDETLLSVNRLDGHGYPFVNIYFSDKNFKQIRIHTLVALTFLDNTENKLCVNHKNGIRTDNRLENLEWVSYSENTLDGIKRGSINKPAKKIEQKDVDEIRKLYENGNISQKKLSLLYNLSQPQICRIINKENWS